MAALIDNTAHGPVALSPELLAVLAGIPTEALERVLGEWLMPGMRTGDAMAHTWQAASVIRRELRRRDVER